MDNRKICPHCNVLLSRKAFEAHRRLYYDSIAQTWVKKRCSESLITCDFDEPVLPVQPSQEELAFDCCEPRTDCLDVEQPPPVVEFGATMESTPYFLGQYLKFAQNCATGCCGAVVYEFTYTAM